MPTAPWIFQHTPQGEIRHAPCIGQHSQEVFKEELGVSEEEYGKLEAEGITGKERVSS